MRDIFILEMKSKHDFDVYEEYEGPYFRFYIE